MYAKHSKKTNNTQIIILINEEKKHENNKIKKIKIKKFQPSELFTFIFILYYALFDQKSPLQAIPGPGIWHILTDRH